MSKKPANNIRLSKERSLLELRFPSEKRYLHMVHQLTSQLAVSTGFEQSEAEKIAMAVDEATTNVIQHAYHGDADQEVEIHYDPEGDSLDIVILHDGEGLEDVPLPEFNLGKLVAERQKGGLGLTIMRQMMDDLRFGKDDSGKSMTVMVRYKQRKS
jgi:serine/threonine-protein kinase RsbW